jgi:hypothetical protein
MFDRRILLGTMSLIALAALPALVLFTPPAVAALPALATDTPLPTATGTAQPTATDTPGTTATNTNTPRPTYTLALPRELCPNNFVTFSGALTTDDFEQTGRLLPDGVPDTCAAPGSCSTLPGAYHYDVFYVHNTTYWPICVTVTVNTSCSGANAIYVTSYTYFIPENVCTGFLASIGTSPNPVGSYSHFVGPSAIFGIVVAETTAGAGCAAYSVFVSTDNCFAPPTAISTATTTPTATGTPTATSTPTATATPPPPPSLFLPLLLYNQ